jgi:D-glycero-D-manno-heptose 1,7-bisphosphate phosphatase
MTVDLLLLDRDGTITENGVRPGDYINDPSEIELIPGVLELLQQHHKDGWTIAILSNQGGVEKGFITMTDCIAGFIRTMELTGPIISAAWFCPAAYPGRGEMAIAIQNIGGAHPWGKQTEFAQYGYRKPYPGMAFAAAFHFGAADADRIVYVGDRPEDREMAANAGCEFIDAEDWRNGGL